MDISCRSDILPGLSSPGVRRRGANPHVPGETDVVDVPTPYKALGTATSGRQKTG